MPEETKPEAKKQNRTRKARTCILIDIREDGRIVARGKSLKDIRAYDKLNLDPNGTYVEAVQIGNPFSVAPVTKIVRKQA